MCQVFRLKAVLQRLRDLFEATNLIEIAYYKVQGGNFGDDLNEALWPHILPPEVYNSERLLLVGIGSILHTDFLKRLTNNKRKIVVVGSGVCYGKLGAIPSSIDVRALRGPLSAAIVGNSEASVTDGAALLALPNARAALVPMSTSKNDVLFMPHHDSFQFSNWHLAAKQAGLSVVDPRNAVTAILEKFASARLVIAEAMHGAIVADTLRIPWIPVSSSLRTQSFKWNDWTMSMDMPFEPVRIPSSSINDGLARRIDRKGAPSCTDWRLAYKTQNHDEFTKSYNDQYVENVGIGREVPPAKRVVRNVVKQLSPAFDALAVYRAAKSLRKLSESPGYLSKESVFQDRLRKLVDRVDSLRSLS